MREWEGDTLCVHTGAMACGEIPDAMMREMRSSVIFLGAILARCGHAVLSYPGGCELGPRPIDLHLAALRAMGVEIEEKGGYLSLLCPKAAGLRDHAEHSQCGGHGKCDSGCLRG